MAAAIAGRAGTWGGGGAAGVGAAGSVGACVVVTLPGVVLVVGNRSEEVLEVEAVGGTGVAGTKGWVLEEGLGGSVGPLDTGGV